MPAISVVLTVYNQEKSMLTKCFDSILCQKDSDQLELIAVDDGSNDETAAFCDAYARKYGNCVVCHQVNQGVSAARNHGIDMCSGSYIMFVDADDWLEKDTVSALLPYIAENPDMVLFNAVTVHGSRCQPSKMFRQDNDMIIGPSEKETMFLDIVANGFEKSRSPVGLQTCWGKLFRRSFLSDGNIRFCEDLEVAEDLCFLAECVKHSTGAIVYTNRDLYYRLVHTHSLMHQFIPDITRNDRCLLRELNRIISSRKGGANVKKALYKRYCLCVLGICRYDICHKKNTDSLQDRIKKLAQLTRSEPYRTGIRKASLTWFRKKSALKLMLLKTHLDPVLIRLLCSSD